LLQNGWGIYQAAGCMAQKNQKKSVSSQQQYNNSLSLSRRNSQFRQSKRVLRKTPIDKIIPNKELFH
jgi:hypothetical protein